MGLEVGNSIIKNRVPRMNGCTVNESFSPEGNAGAILWVILSTDRNINLPSTEKELQVREGCLEFRMGCNELDLAAIKRHSKSICCLCEVAIAQRFLPK